MEQPQLNIDFKNTTSVEGFDGGKLFGQAVIIRKVSKFLVGSDEDMLMPIPVFYDLDSKKILIDSLPKELRDEYQDIALDYVNKMKDFLQKKLEREEELIKDVLEEIKDQITLHVQDVENRKKEYLDQLKKLTDEKKILESFKKM